MQQKFLFFSFLATAGAAVLIVFAGLFAGYRLSSAAAASPSGELSQVVAAAPAAPDSTETTADLQEPEPDPEPEAAPDVTTADGISLPGFGDVVFKSGTRSQSMELSNPASNNCYLVASLMLPDGTEIYHSQIMRPGDSLERITLERDLSPGSLADCSLRYDCYNLETMEPLNGATSFFNLEVE